MRHRGSVRAGHPHTCFVGRHGDRTGCDGTAGVTAPEVASIRDSVLSVALATQIVPPAAATASGPLPTWIVSTTLPEAPLMRLTVRSPLLATQTEPPAAAIPTGAVADVNHLRLDVTGEIDLRHRVRAGVGHP